MGDLDGQVRSAFIQTHAQVARLTQEAFQNEVDVTALIEVLIAQGVVGLNEFDARRRAVDKKTAEARSAAYAGPTLYPSSPEIEPTAEILIDCESRHSECRAACCGLCDVFLTAEDVGRRSLLWDLGFPYRLMRAADGYCRYLDRESLKCTNWDDRPHVCRHYSCHQDANIWSDFEQRVAAETVKRFIADRLHREHGGE